MVHRVLTRLKAGDIDMGEAVVSRNDDGSWRVHAIFVETQIEAVYVDKQLVYDERTK